MKRSVIGWLILLAGALIWEGLGLLGVDGIWPLTYDVRWALDHNEDVSSLALCLTIVGFPAWLLFHFFEQKRRYPGKK